MDLNLELVEAAKDKPIGEATLAKMEWVIVNETMPPREVYRPALGQPCVV